MKRERVEVFWSRKMKLWVSRSALRDLLFSRKVDAVEAAVWYCNDQAKQGKSLELYRQEQGRSLRSGWRTRAGQTPGEAEDEMLESVVELEGGIILRHEVEYEEVYSWRSPIAHRFPVRQVTFLSTDAGVTWTPVDHLVIRQDDDGRAIIEIVDRSQRRQLQVQHWAWSRWGDAGDAVGITATHPDTDEDEDLDTFNTIVGDEGTYQNDDSGSGMTLDELLGNIDEVLDDHKHSRPQIWEWEYESHYWEYEPEATRQWEHDE